MRELKRSVAKANMRDAGLRKINKRVSGKSFFAEHWREWAGKPRHRARERRTRRAEA